MKRKLSKILGTQLIDIVKKISKISKHMKITAKIISEKYFNPNDVISFINLPYKRSKFPTILLHVCIRKNHAFV
jgi:hypothetical protein